MRGRAGSAATAAARPISWRRWIVMASPREFAIAGPVWVVRAGSGNSPTGRSKDLFGNADHLGQTLGVVAQRGRSAVVDDATLVEHHAALGKFEGHAAVLLDQDDRQPALTAEL